MRRRILAALVTGAAWLTAGAAEVPQTAPSDPVARGEYLTHHVSMCVVCHSPKTRSGDVILEQQFQGGAIPFERPWPESQKWAARAPALAKLPGFSDEEVVHILTTGTRFSGQRPQPPMPPFRLSQQDAEAIVAYLKSL